jgi:menaquinone-dependent protoporphyrinogen oxidase
MGKRVLVAFGTKSGSTAEVAQEVGQAMREAGVAVEVRSAREVRSTAGYDLVVLGAPRVTEVWHPDASDFLERLHTELAHTPVAYFVTSMTLTRVSQARVGSIPIVQDPAHSTPPQDPRALRFLERHRTPAAYLAPILRLAPDVVPLQVAFLAGKLDFGTLSLPIRLALKLIFGMKPADLRNWEFIRAWARGLAEQVAEGDGERAEREAVG